jgi:hypothetical protein
LNYHLSQSSCDPEDVEDYIVEWLLKDSKSVWMSSKKMSMQTCGDKSIEHVERRGQSDDHVQRRFWE